MALHSHVLFSGKATPVLFPMPEQETHLPPFDTYELGSGHSHTNVEVLKTKVFKHKHLAPEESTLPLPLFFTNVEHLKHPSLVKI